jgi:hypothetical protein
VQLVADPALIARQVDGGLDLGEVDVAGPSERAPDRLATGTSALREPGARAGAVVGSARCQPARAKSAAEEAEIDEFWCVFDVEWPRNHPHLPDAIARAEANDIKLAISNPCFELWLILHYLDHGSWLENSQAVELRRQLDGSTNKSLDAAKYMPRIEDAVRHAAVLDTRHERNRTGFPHNNPSSGMHHLIASVRPPSE